jgi:hypothetical protein
MTRHELDLDLESMGLGEDEAFEIRVMIYGEEHILELDSVAKFSDGRAYVQFRRVNVSA